MARTSWEMTKEKVEGIRCDILSLCRALSRPDRVVSLMPESRLDGRRRITSSTYWDILIEEGRDEQALTINYSVKRRPKYWVEEIDERGDIFKSTDLFSNWDKSKFEREFSRIGSG